MEEQAVDLELAREAEDGADGAMMADGGGRRDWRGCDCGPYRPASRIREGGGRGKRRAKEEIICSNCSPRPLWIYGLIHSIAGSRRCFGLRPGPRRARCGQ